MTWGNLGKVGTVRAEAAEGKVGTVRAEEGTVRAWEGKVSVLAVAHYACTCAGTW